MLELQNIKVRYPEKSVLKGFSLQLAKGECLALFGENGSGKTTLLKAIAGLVPFEGSFAVDGETIGKDDYLYKKKLGFLLKEEGFFSKDVHLKDHFSLMASLYGLEERPYLETVEGLCTGFGLELQGKTLIRNFSDGMRQKAMFVGAISHRPTYLLLDEPFNFMDEKALSVAFRLLKLRTAEGCGVLLITHSTDMALNLAQRAVLLHNGSCSEALSTAQIASGNALSAHNGSLLEMLLERFGRLND